MDTSHITNGAPVWADSCFSVVNHSPYRDPKSKKSHLAPSADNPSIIPAKANEPINNGPATPGKKAQQQERGQSLDRQVMSSTHRTEGEMVRDVQKKLQQTTDPLEKIRLSCLSRGCSGIKTISRMFRIIDDDGSRKLDLAEFTKGLHDYGVSLNKDEIKSTFDKFDKDKNGTIDFDEFLINLRPPMSQSRQTIILQAFRKLDKNGNGVVTVDDMKGVYDVSRNPKFLSGEATQDQLFKQFLATFEASDHPDGTVTKDEFINYYAGVSASIDNDMYFDLMMRNAWKL